MSKEINTIKEKRGIRAFFSSIWRKKKIIIPMIIAFSAAIGTILVVTLNDHGTGGGTDSSTKKNIVTISDENKNASQALYFDYVKQANNGKYSSVTTSEYAIVIGLSQDGINAVKDALAANNEVHLEFPDYYIYSDGTNFKYIPVKEINCNLNDPSNLSSRYIGSGNLYLSQFSYYKSLLSTGGNNFVGTSWNGIDSNPEAGWVNNITALTVPETCEYIEVGSFHGLDNLTEITLPFIGTERGNYIDHNTDSVKHVGYKSSFGSIFGYGTVLYGASTSSSLDLEDKYYPATDSRVFNYYDDSGNVDPHENDTSKGFEWYSECYKWYAINTSVITMLHCPWSLKTINITDETCIADHAFLNLFNVENINVTFNSDLVGSTNVKSIGYRAFDHCNNLVNVVLPESVSSISEGTFSQCFKLTNVTLPKDLKEIPYAMFEECSSTDPDYGLVSLEVPTSIEKIGKQAFFGCKELVEIYSSKEGYKGSNIITIPSAVKEIGEEAFRNCEAVTNIVVGNQCEEIGACAFANCIFLKSITLPFIGARAGTTASDADESLFGYVFAKLDNSTGSTVIQNPNGYQVQQSNSEKYIYYIPENLTSVYINNETYVAPGAFMNCKMIKILELNHPGEDKEMYISKGALYGCSNIETLVLPFVGPKDYTSWSYNIGSSDYSTSAVYNQYQLGWIFGVNSYDNAIAHDSYGTYASKHNYDAWYIPASLSTVKLTHQYYLPTGAFYRTNSIETLIIGKYTVRTMDAPFYQMKKLQYLELPYVGQERGEKRWATYYQSGYGWVHRYGYWSPTYTYHCSLAMYFGNLGKIDGCYLNKYQYYYNVTIPSTLTELVITDDTYIHSIGFQGFSSIERLSIKNGESDVEHLSYGIFNGCSNLQYIYLPFIGTDDNTGNLNAAHYTIPYLFGETSYTNSYEVANGYASYQVPKSLEVIEIEKGITHISQNAFRAMSSVKTIKTEAAITTLGNAAFMDMTNLSILRMDNAAYTNVSDYAFANDFALGQTSEFLPSTVRTIGNYALQGTAITGISNCKDGTVLKQNITSLGNGVFKDCVNITEFNFKEYTSLTSVGTHLFEHCTNLVYVTLNKHLTSYMFKDCVSLQNLDLTDVLKNITMNWTTIKATSSFADVSIPDGLCQGCLSLKSYDSQNNTGINLGATQNHIVSIGNFAFKDCRSLEYFDIPSSVLEIGNGAFQNCVKLPKITIPADCYYMIAGTNKDNMQDDLTNGIFYGCNDDFYLEVYHQESSWPSTWGYNWNCWYPVYIVGGSTGNMFTYEYSDDYKGYLITGLNYDDYTFATHVSGAGIYLIKDNVLQFPSIYNGLTVYGIKENAFSTEKDQDALSNVDTFVLGTDYIYLGPNTLSFNPINQGTGQIDQSKSDYRTVYIYSRMSASKAETIQDLHFSEEVKYSSQAMVFYQDSWKMVGTIPTILFSALDVELESYSYTYQLGKEIFPKIISIGAKNGIIACTSELVEEHCTHLINDIFYTANGFGLGYDKEDLSLDNVNIQYVNNVNVGNAKIIITSNTVMLNGSKTITFNITKYEMDLFTESDTSDSLFAKYGPYNSAYQVFMMTYMNYKMSGNRVNTSTTLMKTFAENYKVITYGQTYEWTNWENGKSALDLPEGYTMTGTLTTTSNNRGIYMDYKSIYGTIPGVSGSFKWTRSPVIKNENGVDVTSNFELIITNAVVIEPYELTRDSLIWDGMEVSGEAYEYEYYYTGAAINPIPYIKDHKEIDLAGQVEVIVCESPLSTASYEAIDPSNILGGKIYYARINKFNTNNFDTSKWLIPDGTQTYSEPYMSFQIIPAKLKLYFNGVHTILETEDYYTFGDEPSEVYKTGKGSEYEIKITGIGYSTITGHLVTSGWTKGVYKNNNTDDPTKTFDFNGSLPFTITSTSRKDLQGTPLDETQDCFTDRKGYYDVTFDLKVEIKYSIFDARLTLEDKDVNNKSVVYEVNESNIYPQTSLIDTNLKKDEALSSNLIEITYGIDGYEHELNVIVKNSKSKDFWTFESTINGTTTTGTNVKIGTELGFYSITLTLAKDKFETLVVTIKLYTEKGSYIFGSLNKQYDREVVNVFDAFLRKPADFKEADIEYHFYDITASSKEISAPSEIGYYRVVITTTKNHSQYFNDVPYIDNVHNGLLTVTGIIDFWISQRDLIINVDKPNVAKPYDGLPWELNAVSSLNNDTIENLLPGDLLTGYFQSKSSKVGIYDSSQTGDFINPMGFKITNSSLDSTYLYKNYRIVYKGKFEILQLEMTVVSSGWEGFYDGGYHTISVNVIEPVTNYTIYYSYNAPKFDNDKNDITDWSVNPPCFVEPSSDVYNVYYKVVSTTGTYKTVYGMETITIKGVEIEYEIDEYEFIYDGFYHSIKVHTTTPNDVLSTKYYAVLSDIKNYDPKNFDPDTVSWSTSAPQFKECTDNIDPYYILVKFEATNYPTKISLPIAMTITKIGATDLSNLISITGYDDYFDNDYHGMDMEVDSSLNDDINYLYFYYTDGTTFDSNDPEASKYSSFTFDANNPNIDFPYKSNDYKYKYYTWKDAGTYELVIKVLKKGYLPTYIPVKINIKPLTLYLDVGYYNDYYDGNYHSAVLKLASNAPNYDNLIIIANGKEITDPNTQDAQEEILKAIQNSNLYYQYETEINGQKYKFDLNVYYGVREPNLNNSALPDPQLSLTLTKYKNVCAYQMFVRVECDNFNAWKNNGAFEIKKITPTYTVIDKDEVQYLARAVENQDFISRFEYNDDCDLVEINTIKTIHDGEMIIQYQECDSNWNVSPSYITAPINLGYYKATVKFLDTTNCYPISFTFNFKIVPRILGVQFEDELEYTGNPQCPIVDLITNTKDSVSYYEVMVDPTYTPTDPGNYKFKLVEKTPLNANYRLPSKYAGDIDYKITNKKVYITYDDSEEYTGGLITVSTRYDGTYCQDGVKFTVDGLLYNHTLEFSATTWSKVRDTYRIELVMKYNSTLDANGNPIGYEIVSNTTSAAYRQLTPKLSIYETQNPVVDAVYYDVYIDVTLTIKKPELEVEYDEVQEVTFNGDYHTFEYTVTSSGFFLRSLESWIDGDTTTLVTGKLSRRDFGEYKIRFVIYSNDYEPYEGLVTLKILRARMDVTLNPYSGVYDGTKQKTTYTIDNLDESKLYQTEKPEIFYIPKTLVDGEGYTMSDLRAFFYDNTPTTRAISNLYYAYTKRQDYMLDAGEYYSVVYFPYLDDSSGANIYGVLAMDEITIEQRTIYFTSTLSNPLIDHKNYDNYKFDHISLGSFIYDTNLASKNYSTNNGLVTGEFFGNGVNNLNDYFIRTVSANAKGTDGCTQHVPNGDPYQTVGDFEFETIDIRNQYGEQVGHNYRPGFEQQQFKDNNNNPYMAYPLQITIHRVALNQFDVLNSAKEYSGKQTYPTINTPSDGPLSGYYYECDENYNITNQTPITGAPINVGYYIVYVTIGMGTNYYGWEYPANPQSNDYLDPNDNTAYRFALLQIIPKTVIVNWDDGLDPDTKNIIVDEWANEFKEIVYDGNYHMAAPKIEDVNGNIQLLGYKIYDIWGRKVNVSSMINAGSYTVEIDESTITGGSNYTYINSITALNILPRSYTITENITEAWLKSTWYKNYTEDDFADWIPGYKLELTVTAARNGSGTFKYASDFIVSVKVWDNNIPSNYEYTISKNTDKTGINNAFEINIEPGTTFAVSNNFEFNLQILLVLEDTGIVIKEADVDVEYSASPVYPDIKITGNDNGEGGYNISYQYAYLDEFGDPYEDYELTQRFDDTNIIYTEYTMPHFTDVGYYRVYYRVNVPGDDGVSNVYTGSTTIRIRQAQAYININKLDKPYDGVGYSASDIGASGKFNISASTSLIFEFKYASDSDDAFSSTFIPIHVGEYAIRVISSADTTYDPNSTVIQNYTQLDTISNVFYFEITPRTVTLVVDDDVTISDEPNNLTYESINAYGYGNLTIDSSSSVSDTNAYVARNHTIENLVTGDALEYKIVTNAGYSLLKQLYNYTNGSETYDYTFDFYSSTFMISWKAYTPDSSTSTGFAASDDYVFKLVFNLFIHYPYIEGVASDVTVKYTGQPIDIMKTDGVNNTNPLKVTVPQNLPSDIAYKFGPTSVSYPYNGKYEKTEPGVYVVFFEVSANKFEPWTGYLTFTITALSRDGLLEWTDISKIYDANTYDGTVNSGGVPDVTWETSSGANYPQLPVKSTWSTVYYTATQDSNGNWLKSSQPLERVTNAGDYIVKVTIPAYGIYAETELEIYFKISRRVYTISGPDVELTYNGFQWTYDVVVDTNYVAEIATNTSTTGLVQQANISGVYSNVAHDLEKAYVLTSKGDVGTYKQTSQTLYISALYDYIIRDSYGEDVTVNYEYTLDFEVIINKADLGFSTNIPADGFIYDGTLKEFQVWISSAVYYTEGQLPLELKYYYGSGLNELHTDVSDLYESNVGQYSFKVYCPGNSNYNPKEQTFTYEIKKDTNTLTVILKDKEYDGTPADWPTIITRDYNGYTTDQNTSGITIKYYEADGVTELPSRPINAGTYYVYVDYPTTDKYAGSQAKQMFKITPCVITVNYTSNRLQYNSIGQMPEISLSAANNNKINVEKLLDSDLSIDKYGSDLSVNWYKGSDVSFTLPLNSKPINVGTYYVRLDLQNDAATNFVFKDTGSSYYYKDYQIIKAYVEISYKGSIQIPTSGDITLSYLTSAKYPLSIKGLVSYKNSSGVEVFPTSMISNILISTYAVGGEYVYNNSYDDANPSSDFTKNFKWSTTSNGNHLVIWNNETQTAEDLSNYDIKLDLKVNVSSDKIQYSITEYSGEYDGKEHTITFTATDGVESYDSQSTNNTLKVYFSLDNSTWLDYLPKFKDVIGYDSNGDPVAQHIYVKIESTIFGTIYLGDSQDPFYADYRVYITPTTITLPDSMIDIDDKVYDDIYIGEPSVSYSSKEGDDLTSYIKYHFYQLDYTDLTGNTYIELDRVDVKDVGTYYLQVEISGHKDYKDAFSSKIPFEITPRKVIIEIDDKSKVYDGVPWTGGISSNNPTDNTSGALFKAVTGITESGLVNNPQEDLKHILSGTVETIYAKAGDYNTSNLFNWKTGVQIYNIDSNGNKRPINLDNYEFIFNFNVKIEKRQFDITFDDIYGYYDGKTIYYTTHTWNEQPLVVMPNGLTNPDDILNYYDNLLIEYNEYTEDLTDLRWQRDPIGKMYGTTTIYYKVIDKEGNYEDKIGYALIKIVPLDSAIDIIDLGLLAQSKVYDGIKWDVSTVKAESAIPGDTRTVRFEVYEKLADGTLVKLSDYPTDVGNYVLRMILDDDGKYSEVSLDCDFEIVPCEIPVYWGANKAFMTTSGDYVYYMYYTGSVTMPGARAYSVVDVGPVGSPWYDEIPLLVEPFGTSDCTSIGHHKVKVSIVVNTQDNYYKNYILVPDTCSYQIIEGLAAVPPGGYPIDFPNPDDHRNNGTGGNPEDNPGLTGKPYTSDKEPGLEGITFREHQYNPADGSAFEYGKDEIVLEVIFNYSDGSSDVYIIHLDQDNWSITDIKDSTDTNSVNIKTHFHFNFPQTLSVPTFEVEAELDSETDGSKLFSWNTNNDKNNQKIIVHLNPMPTTQDPKDPSATYIWLETPNNNSLTGTNPLSQVKYAANDPNKPNENIIVWLDVNNTPNNKTDDKDISEYADIFYGNNINPTASNAASDEYAYFIVKSKSTSLYTFEFGDYSKYEAAINAHPQDSDWIYENICKDACANAAFTFKIVSPEPTVITLVDDANNTNGAKFVSYDTSGTKLVYTYAVSNDDREKALMTKTNIIDRWDCYYKLSHIEEQQTFDSVLKMISNKREYLLLTDSNGTVLWDGVNGSVQNAIKGTNTLDIMGTSLNDFVRTGWRIYLYSDTTTTRNISNAIDAVEIVIAGDTDGDGRITADDAGKIKTNTIDFSLTSLDMNTSFYYAGLLTAKLNVTSNSQSVDDAGIILTYTAEMTNNNFNYIEDQFYKSYY